MNLHSTFNLLHFLWISSTTQGRVEGWDSMKPLHWRPVNIKDADHACRIIIVADEMKWNEMNEMSMGKWWNEIRGRENGRNPEKKLTRSRFVHHETYMEWSRRKLGTLAAGGERLTGCATGLPAFLVRISFFFSQYFTDQVIIFLYFNLLLSWDFKSMSVDKDNGGVPLKSDQPSAAHRLPPGNNTNT